MLYFVYTLFKWLYSQYTTRGMNQDELYHVYINIHSLMYSYTTHSLHILVF